MNKLTQLTLTLSLSLSLGLTATAIAGDSKAGAPAVPAKEKAADPKADAKKAPDAAPKMEMPKPAAELAELAKTVSGTWKCTGQVSMDGKTMIDTKATVVNKLDLDKWWLTTTLTASMGKETYKFMGYTTYNSLDKKWNRYMVDNMGGFESNTSPGLTAGKMVWEGESKMSVAMMGFPATMKARHTEEISDKSIHMVGEMSTDGKTWVKGYESTCKK